MTKFKLTYSQNPGVNHPRRNLNFLSLFKGLWFVGRFWYVKHIMSDIFYMPASRLTAELKRFIFALPCLALPYPQLLGNYLEPMPHFNDNGVNGMIFALGTEFGLSVTGTLTYTWLTPMN